MSQNEIKKAAKARPGKLGANQLRWCRDHIAGFREMEAKWKASRMTPASKTRKGQHQ